MESIRYEVPVTVIQLVCSTDRMKKTTSILSLPRHPRFFDVLKRFVKGPRSGNDLA